jgi:thiol:disulfide interchange protein
MRKSIMLAVAALALGAAHAAAQPKTDIGYDPHADAFVELDSAVAQAKAEDKLVLLISGGDWCIWCHYLAAFLERETAIDAALHDVFVVQKVYVGDENMNKAFFARLPEAAGAPHFWVLSGSGEVLASQNTLPLEDGDKSYDRAKFAAFIEQWRSARH